MLVVRANVSVCSIQSSLHMQFLHLKIKIIKGKEEKRIIQSLKSIDFKNNIVNQLHAVHILLAVTSNLEMI